MGGGGSRDMILVYEIPDPNTNIELAIQANSTWFSDGQAAVINWCDGSAKETVSATSDHTGFISHTYASAGTYTIKISGSMTMYGRHSYVNIAGQELLTRVDSFGKLGITSLAYAFYNCTGLASVPKTVPDSVTNMSYMFRDCSGDAFNPDVSNWDVSKVTNMRSMFQNCSGDAFNPDVSNWNVSKVTNMYAMFYNCRGDEFSPDVSKWDVSKVTNMAYMFASCRGAAFNPNVSNWDVSNVTNMHSMFSYCRGAAFNPNVSNWDVSNVTDMSYMFRECSGAAFNPDMKSWTLKTGVNTTNMFLASKTQTTEWLDNLLVAWAANSEQGDNITINFSPNSFTEVEGEPLPDVAAALTTLIGKGWNITTANPYSSTDMILVYEIPDSNTDIELAIQANSTYFSAGQSVNIDWGDGSAKEAVSDTGGDTYIGHTYASAGTYTIRISGSMKMYGRGSAVDIAGQELLTRVDSFGKLGLTSFAYAFYNCTGLASVPKTVPSGVTNMSNMFRGCSGDEFNPDVSNWDVSKVTNMRLMFYGCRGDEFNPNVSNWDVSNVTDMYYMFHNCYGAAFNPDVYKWDVSKVTYMTNMFAYCSGAAFNPNVSNWDVSKVTDMRYMFYYCRGDAFNPNVSNWDVSNVTDMSYMFRGCSGAAFNPDMKSWTLKTGVRTTDMFTGSKTQPTEWLDELLVAWANNPEQGNDITIDFSPNKFTVKGGESSTDVASALQTLIGKGWNITTANPYPAT